jgi:hypothetical protein
MKGKIEKKIIWKKTLSQSGLIWLIRDIRYEIGLTPQKEKRKKIMNFKAQKSNVEWWNKKNNF